jgi:serine/threonine-protein kinase HipA
MNVISERTLYVGLAADANTAPTAAGILKLARRDMIESGSFAYGHRYLAEAGSIAINPLHLPLQNEPFSLQERRLRDGGALPLTARDALPDAWGRLVLEAEHGPLNDIDVLLMTNAERVGAMVFAETLPLAAPGNDCEPYELGALAEAANRLEFRMDVPADLRRLLQQGGSLGGARPKANFIHQGRRCIAKFPARDDELDVQLLEAATLTLASACGIRVPSFCLLPIPRGHALVLERFDREGPASNEHRIHYLSASALLDVPYESSAGSYAELALALRRISAEPTADMEELFRRLVFNILVDNSDDHIKNHGVLHVGGTRYRLSPAFDLVPQRMNLGSQQLAILPGKFDSHLDLAREAAPHFGLSPQAATKIIVSIAETISTQWRNTLQSLGAPVEMLRALESRFDAQFKASGAASLFTS